MSQADKGNAEPSMEEILASIRRIISDDKEEDVPVDAAADAVAAPDALPVSAKPNAPANTAPINPIATAPAAITDDAAPGLSEEVPVIDTPPQEGAEEMELTEILEEEPVPEENIQPEMVPELVDNIPDTVAPSPAPPPEKPAAQAAKSVAAPAATLPVMTDATDIADTVVDTERSLVSPPVRALSTNMLADLAGAIHARGFVLGNVAMTLEDLIRDLMRPHLKEWLDKNLPGIVERMVRAEIERMVREAEARKDLI